MPPARAYLSLSQRLRRAFGNRLEPTDPQINREDGDRIALPVDVDESIAVDVPIDHGYGSSRRDHHGKPVGIFNGKNPQRCCLESIHVASFHTLILYSKEEKRFGGGCSGIGYLRVARRKNTCGRGFGGRKHRQQNRIANRLYHCRSGNRRHHHRRRRAATRRIAFVGRTAKRTHSARAFFIAELLASHSERRAGYSARR